MPARHSYRQKPPECGLRGCNEFADASGFCCRDHALKQQEHVFGSTLRDFQAAPAAFHHDPRWHDLARVYIRRGIAQLGRVNR